MDRILVNCSLRPSGIEHLRQAGFEARIVPETDLEASYREAPACVGVVANAILPFDAAFFDLARRVRVIGRMGVGVDNVDVEEATRRGVRVVNTPLPVIEPVAEHTFALILALVRKVAIGDRMLREGRFREEANRPGSDLVGKILGIVGMGNTGRRVAEIARLGFRMRILYFDLERRPEVEERLEATFLPLGELLERSDFVSLHLSLTPATRHLIDSAALRKMRRGSFLINLSRGAVVDEEALVEALRAGRLAGAGLDVFETEPPARDHPLFRLENVVVTPHRGGFSDESTEGCSRVVEDVVRVLRGEKPRFPVN